MPKAKLLLYDFPADSKARWVLHRVYPSISKEFMVVHIKPFLLNERFDTEKATPLPDKIFNIIVY